MPAEPGDYHLIVLIELITTELIHQLETNIATYTIDTSMHACSVASAAAEPGTRC